MKLKFLPLFIIYIMYIGFAGATYSWSGSLYIGDKIQVNSLTIYIDMNKMDNRTAAVVYEAGKVKTLIYENESKEIENLNIEVHKFNDYVILSITSEKPFTLSFNETREMKDYSNEINTLKEENAKLKQENEQLKKQVEQLTNENKALKRRVSDLEKQLKDLNAQDVSKLQAQINNLTKENRELKAQIANQTQLINSLKGENNFLEQQNKEYKTLISKLVEEQAQKSEKNYIEKAKKERLIGSIIIKSLLVGGVVVGLVGYGLYRKKRSWELA